MKSTTIITALRLIGWTALCFSLSGCSAFTAPKDPATGIRQDLPAEWSETNPLDTLHQSAPVPTADGRFGRHWKGYRGF